MVQSTPSQTFTRSDLDIREARPTDRAALEAIAAQIWDGQDYLPRVLDQWYTDPQGGFYVATLRDRVIGVTKLTRLDEEEWWLEGLRVDPAFQGYGISRILHHFILHQLRQRGQGIVRFSTASENEAVQRLAAETGFEQVASFISYQAGALAEPVESLRPLNVSDLPLVREFLNASLYYAQAGRSLEWDWCFYLITDQRLADWLAAGRGYGWPFGNPLGGVVLLAPQDQGRWPDESVLKAGYFDVPTTEMAAAARDLRRLAAALGRSSVMLKIVKQADGMAALEQAGYTREWDGETWLYARDVSLTQHADVRTEVLPPPDPSLEE